MATQTSTRRKVRPPRPIIPGRPVDIQMGGLDEDVEYLYDLLEQLQADAAQIGAVNVPGTGFDEDDVLLFQSGQWEGVPKTELLAVDDLTDAAVSGPLTGHGLRWNGSAFVNAFHDHGTDLAGLADDDHTQYALLAGRSGGQTLNGGTAAGNDLTLLSTAHATKGKLLFGTSAYDEVNNRLGIGQATPTARLHLAAGTAAASTGPLKFTSGTNLTSAENGVWEWDGTDFFATPSATTRKVVVLAPTSPNSYTQTYSTADRTIANPVATALTHGVGTADGTVDDVGAAFNQTTLNNNFRELTDQIANLVADALDLKQGLTAVIDDLQTVKAVA